MQNLYMMAAQIREQEMRKMAIQVNSGLLTIEQAMIQYNVNDEQAVSSQIKTYKRSIKNSEKQLYGFADVNVQAA